jgi:hypothetical protein
MKLKKSHYLLFLVLFVFTVLGLVFLLLIGNSQLEEVFPSLQFFADSNTYIKTYQGYGDQGTAIRVDGNYLGPSAILTLFHGNNYLILIFNVVIFAFSTAIIADILNINSLLFGFFLLISPLTISSLLSVNKEVFLLPFLAISLIGYVKQSPLFYLLAISISLLVRWQLAVFYIILIFITSFNYAALTRARLLLCILIAISFLYLLLKPFIEPVLIYSQLSIDSYDSGSGLFQSLLESQNRGLYFLLFPLKAFHLLFSMGFKLDKIFNPVELYNDFFVSVHCLISFLVFSLLIAKRRLSLQSDLLFAAALFLMVFCVTPVFSPRYLYFVYVLGVLVLAGAPDHLRGLQIHGEAR